MQVLKDSLGKALDALRAAVEPMAAEREALFRRDEEAVLAAARGRKLRDAGATLAPAMEAAIVAGATPRATKSGREVAAWWADGNARRVLVLRGGTGCGKTVAANWAIAQHSRGGRIRSASLVAQHWKSTSYKAEDIRAELADCGLLVIDDVGAEHQLHREWLSVALRDLLEQRQVDGLRTILTTNLTRQQIDERYGDPRVTSRLQAARWVTDTGADRRKP